MLKSIVACMHRKPCHKREQLAEGLRMQGCMLQECPFRPRIVLSRLFMSKKLSQVSSSLYGAVPHFAFTIIMARHSLRIFPKDNGLTAFCSDWRGPVVQSLE